MRRGRGAIALLLLAGLLAACALVEDLLPPVHRSLDVEPRLAVIEVDDTVQLMGTVRDGQGRTLDGSAIEWASADAAVVSVNAAGLVTAIGVGGPVDVTATIGSGTVITQVVVVPRLACPELGHPVDDAGHAVEVLGVWEDVSAEVHRYAVPGEVATSLDYTWGPGSWGNRYAPARDLFPVACGDQLAVVWQAQDTGRIYVTKILDGSLEHGSMHLVTTPDVLVAAAYGDSRVFVVTMERIDEFEERPVGLRLHAIGLGADEGIHRMVEFNTGRSGFNVVASATATRSTGHAALAFSDGRLSLLLARMRLKGDDGINHQGGLAAIFDAQTLALTRYLAQTSGHSFQNQLVVDRDGGFLAIDMADNYPRGVHLHRFDEFEWRRQVVFTFKTLHGTVPRNPAGTEFPIYEAISTPEQTFYRWSNDNNTYSELGAVIEVDDGYLSIFVGEPDAQGRALRNETAVDYVFHPRAIGLVKVRRDFAGNAGEPPNVVPDDIVLTSGITEEGEFYTFGGSLALQRNTGVRWLTTRSDVDDENASRVKAVRVGPDRIVVLWEQWTRTAYVETLFMVVDDAGDVVADATSMGALSTDLRLHRANDPIAHAGKMVLVFGDPADVALNVLVVTID